MTTEMYFSVDVETDGDCPGTSSMLSIGIVSLDPETQEPHEEFCRTLKRLPDARPMNETMEWWDKFPQQWAETRKDPMEPAAVMLEIEEFVKTNLKAASGAFKKEFVPVFVASPAGFDFTFYYYYAHRFLGRSVFGFSALDLKSYCMALSDCPYLLVKRNRLPEWVSKLPHTHNALEDARQQADEFRKILAWRKEHLLVPKALKQEEIAEVTPETKVEAAVPGRLFAPSLPPIEYWLRHYFTSEGGPGVSDRGCPLYLQVGGGRSQRAQDQQPEPRDRRLQRQLHRRRVGGRVMTTYTQDLINSTLEAALEKWGDTQQWRMVQEECAELIAAVNRHLRGRKGAREALIEEVADVILVIQQARIMAGPADVDAMVVKKAYRLMGRLEEDGAIGGGEKE